MKKLLLVALTLLMTFCLLLTSCDTIEDILNNANVGFTEEEPSDNTDKKPNEDKNESPSDETEDVKDVEYTVTFDSVGGSTISSQKVKKGDKVAKPQDPTKEGYIFDGWYVADEKWVFSGYVVTENITLTAKWTKITVTHNVKFVNENGELISTVSVNHGEKVIAPYTPSKSGCEFVGWMQGNSAWNFDEAIVTEDIILKPKWKASITYVLAGGTNASSNPAYVYSDSAYPIALAEPTLSGYTFGGWYSDDKLTNKVSSITSFKSHIFYALWIADENEPEDDGYINEFYPWTTTSIIIQVNTNSDNGQLPDSARRYLAGDITGNESDYSTIDEMIKMRNDAALEHANVTVSYQYLPDLSEYGWSHNIDSIQEEVNSKSADKPDIYINFTYDLVAASLKGSFANLKSTTMPGTFTGSEHNYFEFATDPNYYDKGEGYMYEHMKSLTLSEQKMYVLSSDYFIDMVRAFTVIPVNVRLLESLQASNVESSALYDRVATYDGDGNYETHYTIEDFFELIWDGKWNYNTLAELSAAVYEDREHSSYGEDVTDVIGFAMDTSSGLAASSMLYCTSFTTISKTYDPTYNSYSYSYYGVDSYGNGNFGVSNIPESLITLCNNLNTLMNTDGVMAISNADAISTGEQSAYDTIRRKFTSGSMLFGGIITLGALELDEYREMQYSGKAYAIVPVPIYDSNDSYGMYLTQIHNNAKLGAISYATEKFAQCTAYLDYQSTHSSKTLNEYYNFKFAYGVMDGSITGNRDMLRFLRLHVRSAYDKTIEGAIGEFYSSVTGGDSKTQQWHRIIADSSFQVTNMRQQYPTLAVYKSQRLYNLITEIYPNLPE